MLTETQEKQLYDLYNKMDDTQLNNFLQTKGLFSAPFLDPSLWETEDDINDDNISLGLYKELEKGTDYKDEKIQKYINQINNELTNDKVILFNASVFKNGNRFLNSTSIYKILDSTDFDKFLILANPYTTEKEIQLYKDKIKDGFNVTDLYDFQYTISKMLLPKMLAKFKDNLHGYPNGLTEDEWNKILLELIWYLREITDEDAGMALQDSEKELKKYQKRILKDDALFGKYFRDLWD